MVFLKKHEVTDENSWLYQMYERRESWCTTYHAGKRYLGLRSNQHSESLHSRIQFNLDQKMTLVELFQHFDNCLVKLRIREATLDFVFTSHAWNQMLRFFVHESSKKVHNKWFL
jgi:zinc finger SWIM domain-containing protein 3